MQTEIKFSIKKVSWVEEALPSGMTIADVIKAYETMVLTRVFDQKAIALQRTGKMGTYPSILGQEAISTAIGMTMLQSDVFVPYYRDQAAMFLRGVLLEEILMYWGGHEQGNNYKSKLCAQDMPICVPIATQFSHAAGIASAIKIRGEKKVVVVTGGDGSTSKGDFLESLNLAGVWHLPIVFIINNNQWAISTPRCVQSDSETLAQKAVGAGIPGVIVDGNDYISTADAISKAMSRARSGKGPTLIEATSYRLSDHTTADDATRYRASKELKDAWEKEPIKKLQQWLVNEGHWSEEKERILIEKVKEQVNKSVDNYIAVPNEPATAMFDYLFSELPKPMKKQYDLVAKEGGESNV